MSKTAVLAALAAAALVQSAAAGGMERATPESQVEKTKTFEVAWHLLDATQKGRFEVKVKEN